MDQSVNDSELVRTIGRYLDINILQYIEEKEKLKNGKE